MMRLLVLGLALCISCGKGGDEKPPEAAAAKPAAAAAPAATPAAAPVREDRDPPAERPAALSLEVTIDGKAATWNQDVFDKVGKLPGADRGGEARAVWSVRALATEMAGPGARVVSVSSDESTMAITPEQWADAEQTPILHSTRRGTFKFRWAKKSGEWLGDAVRDVTRLEIVH